MWQTYRKSTQLRAFTLSYTQYELAKRAGLKSKDTVCRLENNEDVDVTGKNLLAIAMALGVTAEELYGTGDD